MRRIGLDLAVLVQADDERGHRRVWSRRGQDRHNYRGGRCERNGVYEIDLARSNLQHA